MSITTELGCLESLLANAFGCLGPGYLLFRCSTGLEVKQIALGVVTVASFDVVQDSNRLRKEAVGVLVPLCRWFPFADGSALPMVPVADGSYC
jgi:hypothetical protein